LVLSDVRPVDEREVARILREAGQAKTPLELRGGGSKHNVGRPMTTSMCLSTRALNGITLYEPNEMVMAARAGTLLIELEDSLAQRGQMLAFEPTSLAAVCGAEARSATIGAVFATNLSGARRITVGAARDHLLGVRAVNGRGEIFKAGGRVMKNVTGVDLCRGLAGSWGTLAVLSEVTFKVLPLPEHTETLVLLGLPDEIAIEVLGSAMGTPFEVSGAVHLQPAMVARLEHQGLAAQGQAVTALRLENFRRSVVYRKAKLKAHLKAYGEIHDLDHDNSLALWQELRGLALLANSEAPLWRISTAPSTGPNVVAAVARYMEVGAFYDWAGGLIWLEIPPTTDAGAADIRRVIATHGGHATLIRAGAEVRGTVDVFQPLEAGVEVISRRLKAAFDPAGILNPGRMYADF
jgi:glycolate oxidase FAD binding subunit